MSLTAGTTATGTGQLLRVYVDPNAGGVDLPAGVTLDGVDGSPVAFGAFHAAALTALAPLASPLSSAQSGTWSVGVSSLPALAAGSNAIGSVTVTSLPAITFAAPQHVIIDSATLGTVTVSGAVTTSGTATVSGTVAVSNFPTSQAVTLASTTITGTVTTSGTATVSGTVAATQSGTWTTVLGAGSSAIGTVAFATAQPVTLASTTITGTVTVSGAVTTSGTVTEASAATIATNTGRIPAQGQALAAASTPAVLPALQDVAALASGAPDATLPTNAVSVGGVGQDTAPSAVTSGRTVRAWRSRVGAAASFLTDVAGAVIFPTASAGADAEANATLLTRLGARLWGWNGTSWDRLKTGPQTAATSLATTDAQTLTYSATSLAAGGVAIKAGPGTIYQFYVQNYSGGVINVAFINTLTTPINTTIPEINMLTIASGAATGQSLGSAGKGLFFSTAPFLMFSTTTGASGITAPAGTTSGVKITISYL